MSLPRRRGWLLAVAVAAALGASAHASAGTIIAPSSASSADAQLFTLAVQPDPVKEGRRIPVLQVDLFVPAGFTVDSFEPTPGLGAGLDGSVGAESTWTRGESDLRNAKERNEAAEHDAVFHFLGRPGRAGASSSPCGRPTSTAPSCSGGRRSTGRALPRSRPDPGRPSRARAAIPARAEPRLSRSSRSSSARWASSSAPQRSVARRS